jgi:trehalose synthase
MNTNSNVTSSDNVIFSKRRNIITLSSPSPEDYTPIIGPIKIERLLKVAERLKGLKLLEINSSPRGGGVAEMLISAIPFLNLLGIDAEWRIITGNKDYFVCTKSLHNLLQGMEGTFTEEMYKVYLNNVEECGNNNLIDYHPNIVTIHDPQPMGLTHYIQKPGEIWLWRCHIDIEGEAFLHNQNLLELMTDFVEHYSAAIFSAADYVVSTWPLPKFIIPPFIDPLSEKNRELSETEIQRVLDKFGIDASLPKIVQIGRFDPWKGIDLTIETYRHVKKEVNCQLIIAGGIASDDPEGDAILARIREQTKEEEDIIILNLSPESNFEINALQRAADVIMQPSTKEGFGLVVTEGLWKGKAVIAGNVGGIPLQIKDGDTGFFYETPAKTSRKVIDLLTNPRVAKEVGERGYAYVRDHFLMPDRIADYLKALDLLKTGTLSVDNCRDCIISFHPWFKLSKRYKSSV